MGADWGRKKPEKEQLKKREQSNSPLSTPNPISSPPPGSQINISPAQVSPNKSPSNPDDCSHTQESTEQGFPPSPAQAPSPKEQRPKRSRRRRIEGEQQTLEGWIRRAKDPRTDDQPPTLDIDVRLDEQTETPGRLHNDKGVIDRQHQPEVTTDCSISRKGYCKTHEQIAKKIAVTSKKWQDRGGGKGFGFVSRKQTKYICSARGMETRLQTNNSDTQMRGSVILHNNLGEAIINSFETESVSEIEKVFQAQR